MDGIVLGDRLGRDPERRERGDSDIGFGGEDAGSASLHEFPGVDRRASEALDDPAQLVDGDPSAEGDVVVDDPDGAPAGSRRDELSGNGDWRKISVA